MGCAEAVVRETVKAALALPAAGSRTTMSDTMMSAGPAGGVMVSAPCASASTAPRALVRLTSSVSAPSLTASASTGMEIAFCVSPGAKVSVPLLVV